MFAKLILLSFIRPVVGYQLAWGSFLGADWNTEEANIRKVLYHGIKDTQVECIQDVQELCPTFGQDGVVDDGAASYWIDSDYERRGKGHFDEVQLGFGEDADRCLHDQFDFDSFFPDHMENLSPKCSLSLEQNAQRFQKLSQREERNDTREVFVMFTVMFAMSSSISLGIVHGMLTKGRWEELGSSLLELFMIAISVPLLVILLMTCPKLLLLMAAAFFVGRSTQMLRGKKQEEDVRFEPISVSVE